MNRRSFFALLAALPVVGRVVPSTMVHMKRISSIDRDGNAYVIPPYGSPYPPDYYGIPERTVRLIKWNARQANAHLWRIVRNG